MDTLVLHIDISPREPFAEIAISWLSDDGFNAFEETKTGIRAYAAVTEVEQNLVQKKIENWALENQIDVTLNIEILPHQNWNAQWESDFKPVEVEDFLTILAPFHPRENTKGLVVEIQPQMSFGTGHHQTTWMMSKAIFEFGKLPERVLDMGTGTGILAILAEKRGAEEIVAIDIEEWSAENSRENALRNNCSKITTWHGDVDLIDGQTFGLILANINKNVLKAQFQAYSKALLPNGRIVISGFFETDIDDMKNFAHEAGFSVEKKWSKESWAALQLKRQ